MTAFAGSARGKEWDVDFHDPKTSLLADMVQDRQDIVSLKLLVVGCGEGNEAAVLAQRLGATVTGIDIVSHFDPRAAVLVDLREGDATRMEFDDESFNFIYSFHALEHIGDYRAALREMHRVLKPGGGYLIGTPNRSRLIGYLGSKNTSVADKVLWNMADWKAKLSGKFRNELGAHAGYTLSELQAELEKVFACADNITSEYYLRLYASWRPLIFLLCRTGLWQQLFPAIYFYGIR
jgi:ubiquinone/menaquinone biosynthesis C-methylase UbiE